MEHSRDFNCALAFAIENYIAPNRQADVVILSRSRGEPRHDTPGENRAVTSAQRTFNECGGFLLRSEVSNANEVEGSRTTSKIPRPLSCGRASGAAVACFCNRRDARVRVQLGLASQAGSYFFSEFLTRDTSRSRKAARGKGDRHGF